MSCSCTMSCTPLCTYTMVYRLFQARDSIVVVTKWYCFIINLNLYLSLTINWYFIEIKREQRELVDNEKENFKTELKKSFNKISLPADILSYLKEKKKNFSKFDGATNDVQQNTKEMRKENSRFSQIKQLMKWWRKIKVFLF